MVLYIEKKDVWKILVGELEEEGRKMNQTLTIRSQ
jgi:hypothetical protein